MNNTFSLIKSIKNTFSTLLSDALNLIEIPGPLFVTTESGLNDTLNGVERPVSFDTKDIVSCECDEDSCTMTYTKMQIVHSLAKWKRYALHKYNFSLHNGLYVDMKAIRRDEHLSPIHSLLVDQYDWEKIISKDDRNIEYLKNTVSAIYSCIRNTDIHINMNTSLPETITFITSSDLEHMYPSLTSKEREKEYTQKNGAICILGIGYKHESRAYDYDDWNLNCDIILWNSTLEDAYEISSMGIRVDKQALLKQANDNIISTQYHQDVLNEVLPYTIGGGIGMSRLCMFLLKKKHIGEVQVSIWPEYMYESYNLL